MSGDPYKPDYDYVAYIDESGDPGLDGIKPLDPNGASEWIVVSAVVIRKVHEVAATKWMEDIRDRLKSPQMQIIHFRRLRPVWRKELVCDAIAKLPIRCFVVCSNKKNMKGHENPFADKVPSQNWFYCWLTRVLLERVTHFVAADSRKRYGIVKRVKIVYSRAGGLSYAQMAAYYEWIREKRRNNNQFLNWGDLDYDTLHSSLLEVRAHSSDVRLSLPDAVANSFYKACDKYDTGACDVTLAKRLVKRMAAVPDKPRGQISGYGVKLLPGWVKAELDADQQEMFLYFGYPKQWWDNRRAPDPFVPQAF
jgi:hypothetical protein